MNKLDNKLIEQEFEKRWAKYPIKDSRKKSLKHWVASVKTDKDLKDFDVSLNNYLLMLKVETWRKPKSGKTFFNNWRDFLNWKGVEKPSIPESTEKTYTTPEERQKADDDLRTGKTVNMATVAKRLVEDMKGKEKRK